MNRKLIMASVWTSLLAVSGFAQKVTLTFQVGGKTRQSNVYVPSGIDKPAVVFFIHGANGSGPNFENETKGDVTADKEKFIAVYPSASANGSAGVWDDMSGTSNFPFFKALIDSVDARYHIDRNRVYMTGFSQGGFISFVAGCSFSDIFAAVAPVSGHAGATCTIKRPVPVFMTFGAQEGAASFIKDLDIWLKLNKCPATPTIVRPYPASKPNSKATQVTYGPCEGGSSVVMDSISGQGHQWPSASNLVQADEVWAFFKNYSLDKTTPLQTSAFTHERNSFMAAYASNRVRLQGLADQAQVQVTDAQGKLVTTAATNHQEFEFKAKSSGIYWVSVVGNSHLEPQKIVVP